MYQNWQKLFKLAESLTHLTPWRCKHFTFILRKKKILSIGWNSYRKTVPLGYKFKHYGCYRHSEAHAIMNFAYTKDYLTKCTLVNVRLNNKGIGLSRPCNCCLVMLQEFGLRDVYFTNNDGILEQL